MPALKGSEAIFRKIRIFFLPYLAITILLALGYTILNWWLLIRNQIFF